MLITLPMFARKSAALELPSILSSHLTHPHIQTIASCKKAKPMSYRCQITNRVSKPGLPLHKIIVETRPKEYTKWAKNEDTEEWEEVFAAFGSEIVRELSVSQEGKDIWEHWSPNERLAFLESR